MICTPHPILCGDKIEKNGMGWACGAYGRGEGVYRVLVGKPEGRKSNKYYIFWASVCSISYSARKAHAAYYIVTCGLSVCLYHVFPHYIINGCAPGSLVGIATRYGLEGPGSNPGGDEIFRTCPNRLWGPPSLLYNGYRVFPGGRGGQGVGLTLPPPSRVQRP